MQKSYSAFAMMWDCLLIRVFTTKQCKVYALVIMPSKHR